MSLMAPPLGAPTPDAAVPATASRGWRAHRFLLLRRTSQALVIVLFLLGPWAGVWWLKGNLSSSRVLDTVPLTDPFLLMQVLATGHLPQATAVLGALAVVAFYLLAGGRSYCAWVCPVNVVTDGAAALRRRLGWSVGRAPRPALRHALLGAVLLACALTGQAVWEAVNPVSLTQRALIFGGGVAWAAVLAVFLHDLLVTPRGWCGSLCPMGATYSLLGRASVLRVSARHSSRCNDCGDCFAVCPEPQVITLPLKGRQGAGPVIRSGDCTVCGRCIDVCRTDVFELTHRFDNRRN